MYQSVAGMSMRHSYVISKISEEIHVSAVNIHHTTYIKTAVKMFAPKKLHMVRAGIEPVISCLAAMSSDH